MNEQVKVEFVQLKLNLRPERPRLGEWSFKRFTAEEKKLIRAMAEYCKVNNISYRAAGHVLSCVIPRSANALACAMSMLVPKTPKQRGRSRQ